MDLAFGAPQKDVIALGKESIVEEANVEENANQPQKMTIVLHSGDLDKVYSALIIGTGALAMGMDVAIFFTFWGLERLKVGGIDKGPLSKMNMLGLGRWMIRQRMKKANVVSLDKLMADYRELGGKVIACDMTMEIMGVKAEDLRQDWIDVCGGVGAFIQDARESVATLFI